MTDLPSCAFPSIQLPMRSPDHDSQPRTSQLPSSVWPRMPTANCATGASIPSTRFLLTRALPRHWHRVGEWGIVLGGTYPRYSLSTPYSDFRLQVPEGSPPSMAKGGPISAISRVPLTVPIPMFLRELRPTDIYVVDDKSPPQVPPERCPWYPSLGRRSRTLVDVLRRRF